MEEKNIFEQDSILKTYFTIATPLTIGMVISVVYNVADTFFIAQTQNTNLVAGVSLCAPVFMILMAFGNIYGQGGSSLLSRLYGKQDLQGTRSVSSFCFYLAILTGIIAGVLMLIFHKPLLYAMGANESSYQYAYQYFMVMAVGAPLVVENFIHMNLLRSEGMSKEATIGSVSGLLVNIILDPIFILGLGMGAFGAALASVIGYVFSDTYCFILVLKKSKILSVKFSEVKIPGDYVKQIMGVGISAAVVNIMSSICLIIINQFLEPYGNEQIAAMGIAQKVSMIILLVLTGMSFGCAPIVGYFYGGKKYDRLKKLLKMVISIVCGTAIVMTLILMALATPAIKLFMEDATIVSAGALMLRLQIATMFLGAVVMIITICFQASGLAKEALFVSLLRQGIVFLAVIFVASRMFGYMGVLSSQIVADVISAIIAGTLFYVNFYKKLGE